MFIDGPLQMAVLVFGFACFAVFLAGLIYALTRVVREPRLEPLEKAVWVLLLVALPVLGVIGWFVFDRHKQRESARHIL